MLNLQPEQWRGKKSQSTRRSLDTFVRRLSTLYCSYDDELVSGYVTIFFWILEMKGKLYIGLQLSKTFFWGVGWS